MLFDDIDQLEIECECPRRPNCIIEIELLNQLREMCSPEGMAVETLSGQVHQMVEKLDLTVPDEIRLLVEVADTSAGFDLKTKSLVYARVDVVEYWVVDVVGRRLVVHRNPSASGYSSIEAFAENEYCSSLAAPDHRILVGDLLPHRQKMQ